MRENKNIKPSKPARDFLADKEFVLSYLKGEITLKTLNAKGVKVAMPL